MIGKKLYANEGFAGAGPVCGKALLARQKIVSAPKTGSKTTVITSRCSSGSGSGRRRRLDRLEPTGRRPKPPKS